MNFENLDINSIIIIVIAICIGLIKVIEIYKSGSYRNTKLNNSKEEMKQVEALRNKYREKFKNKIKDVKEDVINEIKNRKFNDRMNEVSNELENIIGEINKLTELCSKTSFSEVFNNNTNNIISSSSSTPLNNSEIEVEIQK